MRPALRCADAVVCNSAPTHSTACTQRRPHRPRVGARMALRRVGVPARRRPADGGRRAQVVCAPRRAAPARGWQAPPAHQRAARHTHGKPSVVCTSREPRARSAHSRAALGAAPVEAGARRTPRWLHACVWCCSHDMPQRRGTARAVAPPHPAHAKGSRPAVLARTRTVPPTRRAANLTGRVLLGSNRGTIDVARAPEASC